MPAVGRSVVPFMAVLLIGAEAFGDPPRLPGESYRDQARRLERDAINRGDYLKGMGFGRIDTSRLPHPNSGGTIRKRPSPADIKRQILACAQKVEAVFKLTRALARSAGPSGYPIGSAGERLYHDRVRMMLDSYKKAARWRGEQRRECARLFESLGHDRLWSRCMSQANMADPPPSFFERNSGCVNTELATWEPATVARGSFSSGSGRSSPKRRMSTNKKPPPPPPKPRRKCADETTTLKSLGITLTEAKGLDRQAHAVVAKVDPNGPAAAGGLRSGDRIFSVGTKTSYRHTLNASLAELFCGRTFPVSVERGKSSKRLLLKTPKAWQSHVETRRLKAEEKRRNAYRVPKPAPAPDVDSGWKPRRATAALVKMLGHDVGHKDLLAETRRLGLIGPQETLASKLKPWFDRGERLKVVNWPSRDGGKVVMKVGVSLAFKRGRLHRVVFHPKGTFRTRDNELTVERAYEGPVFDDKAMTTDRAVFEAAWGKRNSGGWSKRMQGIEVELALDKDRKVFRYAFGPRND